MKVYINNRKVGDVYEKAMTIYSNRGKLLYSAMGRITEENMQKFDKTLYALEWGIKKFRYVSQQGVVSEREPVIIYMNSKTIYEWLRKESCPKNYIKIFSDIQMELSLMLNEVEIIYSQKTKALYKNTDVERISIKSLFNDFKDIDD